MNTQMIDAQRYALKAGQIRIQVSAILKKWGLLSRFRRWRITKDPETGMVVLFGVLNVGYIAAHTTTPFSNYFDPALLNDLAAALQLEVVSCNSDGLSYAFILNHGQLGRLPTHVDFPYQDGHKLLFRVVYSDMPVPESIEPTVLPAALMPVDDKTLVRQGAAAFLKVLDDIKIRDDAALLLSSSQNLPDIVIIDEDEFKKRVAENEADRQRIDQLRQLLGGDLLGGELQVSKKMQQAMMYALVNGGKLRRYRGGFWAMEKWRPGLYPWFGTSTVRALVSRGLMAYTEYNEGHRGRFPVAAVVVERPGKPA